MTIFLLDGTIEIEIFFECDDHDLEDNICVKIFERCAPSERLFRAGETNIFLTPEQARELGLALMEVADSAKTTDMDEGSGPLDIA